MLQFKSINSSVLSFLYNQLSHPYMTSGKTIADSWPYINRVHSKESNRLGKLLLTPLTERRLCLIICKELLQIKSKQKLPSIKRGDEHCLELCWLPAGVATPASASQGPGLLRSPPPRGLVLGAGPSPRPRNLGSPWPVAHRQDR